MKKSGKFDLMTVKHLIDLKKLKITRGKEIGSNYYGTGFSAMRKSPPPEGQVSNLVTILKHTRRNRTCRPVDTGYSPQYQRVLRLYVFQYGQWFCA